MIRKLYSKLFFTKKSPNFPKILYKNPSKFEYFAYYLTLTLTFKHIYTNYNKTSSQYLIFHLKKKD